MKIYYKGQEIGERIEKSSNKIMHCFNSADDLRKILKADDKDFIEYKDEKMQAGARIDGFKRNLGKLYFVSVKAF